jgi:hypothetical protein
MNVENRKLFANRDARKRLAEMGGILASSPELMGEAMKFANGGQAQEQEFIINIPGLTSPGEMLRIKESTLMQLGDMFPDLMGQQNALVQPVELMGAEAMNARPGDAVIGTRISRMMQQSAPEDVVLESAPITSGEQPSLMERVRSQAYSSNPIEDAFKKVNPPSLSSISAMVGPGGGDMSNPFVKMLQAGSVGAADEATLSEIASGISSALDTQSQNLSSTSATGAEDLMQTESFNIPPGLRDTPRERAISGEGALDQFATDGMYAEPEAPPTNLALLSDSRLEAERLSRKSIVPNFVMDVIDNVQTAAGTVGAGAADVVGSTLAALGATDAGAKFLESAKNRRDVIATINAAEKERESETVADVAEVVAEQERRDPTGPMSEIDDGTGTDFSLVPKETIAKAVEKNDPKAASAALMKSITGVDVHGGTTPPLVEGDGKSPPSDDTPDAPKTRKQRMLESVDMVSELFGIREKDKAEDMYDLMATIGFAMASGESPNAMKNIADAFLVGAQMKRADKKEDKKLDQAIRTLAVKDVLEQESDERALAQLLAKEERQEQSTLRLFAEKLRIKEEMDPTSPAGRYLSSELGDAVLEIYAEVLKDENINPDDKGAEFFKRAGEKNATQFLGLTGFSAMGGGVGVGVTPTGTTLDFGEG